jgi:hypothetical protein
MTCKQCLLCSISTAEALKPNLHAHIKNGSAYGIAEYRHEGLALLGIDA